MTDTTNTTTPQLVTADHPAIQAAIKQINDAIIANTTSTTVAATPDASDSAVAAAPTVTATVTTDGTTAAPAVTVVAVTPTPAPVSTPAPVDPVEQAKTAVANDSLAGAVAVKVAAVDSAVVGAASKVGSATSTVYNSIKSGVSGAITAVEKVGEEAVQKLEGVFTTAPTTAQVEAKVETAAESIKAAVEPTLEKVEAEAAPIEQDAENFVTGSVESLTGTTTLDAAKEKIYSMFHWLLVGVLFHLGAHYTADNETWHQISTLLWKLGNATLSAYIGFLIDLNLRRVSDNTDTAANVNLCRAIVIGAVVIAVAIGA